jgi:ubiquinone/menaquinone biosynthesis C-methylase UbiE
VPVMSAVERSFCRSAPWRIFARRVVLPWALAGEPLTGEVLELGAGCGAMAQSAVRAFPEVRLTVTDVDPVMVASAGRRLSGVDRVTVREADVTALPFDGGSYDVVASYLMLHHVVDWPAALEEARRVLRPGGSFLGYDLTDTRIAHLVHLVDRSPHRLVAVEELRRGLEVAGFVHVTVRPAYRHHLMRFRAVVPETTRPAPSGSGETDEAGRT